MISLKAKYNPEELDHQLNNNRNIHIQICKGLLHY